MNINFFIRLEFMFVFLIFANVWHMASRAEEGKNSSLFHLAKSKIWWCLPLVFPFVTH